MHVGIDSNAIMVGAIALYLVYTSIVGDRDYKQLCAATEPAQRLIFFRKWSFELVLLSLAGIGALWVAGRSADLITFPQAFAPVHGFISQPIAAIVFWLLFGAFCLLILAPLFSVIRLAPNEANAKRARKTLAATALIARDGRERAWGTLMCLGAGIGEEVVFRLLLPVALFALSHNLPAALAISIIGFGIGHAYQGVGGVLMTAATGALMFGVYAATQSLWFVAAFHAFVDYRAVVVLGWLLDRLARAGTGTTEP